MLAGQETVGGVTSGVTVTLSVAELLPPSLSVTRSVKLELVAVQLAATSAVTLPFAAMLMLDTVTPEPVNGVAVTLKEFAA